MLITSYFSLSFSLSLPFFLFFRSFFFRQPTDRLYELNTVDTAPLERFPFNLHVRE